MSNPQYPPPPSGAAPVNANQILIMGILSLFCFGIILGPIAWIQGNNALAVLAQTGDPANQRGTVNTGRILGIVGTVLWVIGLIIRIGLFANHR